MKKQVWKFTVPIKNEIIRLQMPLGAEILSVQNQKESLCFWALVNPENDKCTRLFEVFGTGHDIHFDMGIERVYLGTAQFSGYDLVFHLFERIN